MRIGTTHLHIIGQAAGKYNNLPSRLHINRTSTGTDYAYGHLPPPQPAASPTPDIDGHTPPRHGPAGEPLCAAKVENRRDTFFEPQCGQADFTPALLTRTSKALPQSSQVYSYIGIF
jgi:hypothetical protein